MISFSQIVVAAPQRINGLNVLYRLLSCQRNVVVTGIGIVSPLGCKTEHVWSRLLNAECGISKYIVDGYEFPCQIAASVPKGSGPFQFDGYVGRETSLASAFAIAAADEAVADSKWKPQTEEERLRAGVALGVAVVDADYLARVQDKLSSSGYRVVSPYLIPRLLLNMSAGCISIKHKLYGPNHAVATACTAGSHAIGDAFRFIAHGDCDVMLAGSSDAALNSICFAGFSKIRALSTKYNDIPQKASRPFHMDRDGLVLGEGAAVLMLEEEGYALRRGARIYARILGYGLSGDASHITAPSPKGDGAQRSMNAAIRDAGIEKTDVTYINAHATATPLGDAAENNAIKSLFGDHAYKLAVSSTKSAIGHLLGGAGSVEAAFTVLACYHGELPPTLNLDKTTPDMDLNYVPIVKQPWKCSLDRRIGLSNSFGFGGTNATLCISSYH